jgi:hypothetical protein
VADNTELRPVVVPGPEDLMKTWEKLFI